MKIPIISRILTRKKEVIVDNPVKPIEKREEPPVPEGEFLSAVWAGNTEKIQQYLELRQSTKTN